MVVKLERKFDPIKLSNRISHLETEIAKLRFRNNSLEDENNELRANINQLNVSKTTFVIRNFSFVEFYQIRLFQTLNLIKFYFLVSLSIIFQMI